MQTACWACGAAVDPLRTPARIIGARIVQVCGDCAGKPLAPSPAPAAPTPAAKAAATFAVEPTEETLLPRPRPVARRASLLGLAAGAIALLTWRVAVSAPLLPLVAQSAAPELAPVEAAVVPPEAAPISPPAPTFVHPLPGPERLLPENGSCKFGAHRDGVRTAICGRGHCGIDIGRKIGTPILAVQDGTVSKAIRYDNERGGLYVRLEHPDGSSSHYFHLKRIRDDLRLGTTVRAGEQIATLGRSGIIEAPAHLHFAISYRERERDKYLDPLPLLEVATVLDAPVTAPPAE